jgi:hypothetical protein
LKTLCHKQLTLESLFSQEVIADFEGGRITSDAGGLLLRELDQRYLVAKQAAACLHDPRDSDKVKHDLLTLVRHRLFATALGYEDNNDAAWLSKDPALEIMAGRAPESTDHLASQPTLSRFENMVSARDLRRLSDCLVDLYLKTHRGPRKVIVLDMDATDDPTHGQQQLGFFHGYHAEHMYHPLRVFDGRDGFPLAAVLRPGNTRASQGGDSGAQKVDQETAASLSQSPHPLSGRCRLCRAHALSLSGRAAGDPLRYRFHHQPPAPGKDRAAPFKGTAPIPGDVGETTALHLFQQEASPLSAESEAMIQY